MPVLRSQRTYPLALTGSSLNASITAAYDWAGDPANSRAGGNGADHSGNSRTWTPGGTTPSVVANIGGVTGMDGRDTTIGGTTSGNYYRAADLAALGCGFGTGAYSFWYRIRMPSVAVATTQAMQITQNKNAAGAVLLVLGCYEVTSTSKYHPRITVGATQPLEWSTSGNTGFAPSTVVDVHVTRSAGGVVKCFINGVKLATGSDSTDWTSGGVTATNNLRGNSTNATRDFVLIDEIVWGRELTEAEVTAQQANPYSYYTNSAPADSITVASPAASATVGTSFTISGTYTGSGSPTTIEASFNGSAYQTIVASPAGGTYSGTFTGASAGTGTLTVRWSNSTAILATVANLTVASASLAFDAPGTVTAADSTRAVAYKLYQANGSNQATARLKGTATGITGNLEWRWNGGSWAVGKASPVGSAFDFNVTLQGPGQGLLEIRDSAATGVTTSLVSVGVGDLFLSAGQSNLVGKSSQYTAPVAPAGNPTWVPVVFGKNNQWRPLLENAGNPFDDRTGNIYTTAYTTEAVAGSMHGALATRIMAAGRPCGFVPCAQGSTGMGQWASGGALYTATSARAAIVGNHKYMLFWDGETDANAGGTQASNAQSQLDAMINAWWTDRATPVFLININDRGLTGAGIATVRAGISAVAAANTHVAGIADMLGAWSSGNVHYDTTTEQAAVASRIFSAVYPGPVITVQPTDRSVSAGATTTFNVTATGATSYQWQRSTDGGSSWTDISGATGASYTTPATTVSGGSANNGDKYRVNVTNSNGTTASAAASLTVTLVTATITTDAWRDPVSSSLLATTTIPHLMVINPSTRAVILSLAGQTTAADGTMVISSASLTAGTTYLVVGFNSTGAQRGAKAFVAA